MHGKPGASNAKVKSDKGLLCSTVLLLQLNCRVLVETKAGQTCGHPQEAGSRQISHVWIKRQDESSGNAKGDQGPSASAANTCSPDILELLHTQFFDCAVKQI